MPTAPLLIPTADRAAAIAAALDALRQGLLAVIPTETVYGLAADARSAKALERLATATGVGGNAGGPLARPSAWHAPGASDVAESLGLTAPIHRRIASRLLPGPVTLQVERSGPELVAIRRRLGVAPGTLDDTATIAARVPDHDLTRELLREALNAGMCIVAQGIGAAGWGDGRSIPSSLPALADLGAVLDDGPTRVGRPSTLIRLLATGGYRVEHEGALPARLIQRRIERTILFVCTGNTCRSPMAEAIAKAMTDHASAPPLPSPPPVPIRILSAGTAAYDGDPATPETVEAVKSLGLDTAGLERHRSHALTAQMLDEADVVFAMTASHVRAAAALNPGSAHKIKLLDPDGIDLSDPIGGDLQVYTRTAQRLQELIRRRLDEGGGAGGVD